MGRISSWARWNGEFILGRNVGSNLRITLSVWKIHKSALIERAANSEIRLAEVMSRRNATLYDRKQSATSLRGSKGPCVKASRTRGKSQEGYRWTGAGRRLEAPLRNKWIRGRPEREPLEPQHRMVERAATCLRKVFGAKPASNPSWRNSSTCKVVAVVETMDLWAHQDEKDLQVES